MTQGKPHAMWSFCDIRQEVRRLFHELVHQSWGGKAENDGRPEGRKTCQIPIMTGSSTVFTV